MRLSHYIAGLLLMGFCAHPAIAATDNNIQMLPPSGCGTVAATAASPLLSFNWGAIGGAAINCNSNINIDNSGNVNMTNGNFALSTGNMNITAGGLNIDGVGPLNGTSATTLLNLQTQSCGPNQALTEITPTNFQCVDIVQLAEYGPPVLVPSCATSNESLTWNGSAFTCQSNTVASCPAGETLTGITNGSPVCTALSFSCPIGQILQGVVNGTPQCAAAPTGNPCQGVTFAGTAATDGSGNPVCRPICPGGTVWEWGNLQCYGSDGCFLTAGTSEVFPNGAIGQTISPASNYVLTALAAPGVGYVPQTATTWFTIGIVNSDPRFTNVIPINGSCSEYSSMTCTWNGWQANYTYGTAAAIMSGYGVGGPGALNGTAYNLPGCSSPSSESGSDGGSDSNGDGNSAGDSGGTGDSGG